MEFLERIKDEFYYTNMDKYTINKIFVELYFVKLITL